MLVQVVSNLKRRRGMVMAYTVLLITTIAAVSTAILCQMLIHQQGVNMRKRELNRAYYDADAGIAIVKHWGNFGEDYTLDTDLFDYVDPQTQSEASPGTGFQWDSGSLETQFPNFYAALQQGTITITAADLASITTSGGITIGDLVSNNGIGAGSIESIEISLSSNNAGELVIAGAGTGPVMAAVDEGGEEDDDDDAPSVPSWATLPPGSTLTPEFVVRSVGVSEHGLRRASIAFMDISPFIKLVLPAALVSWNTATAFGNAAVHWGESWSKLNFNMLNKSQVDGYLDRTASGWDKWAKYRTEGKIVFPNNWQWKNSTPYNQPGKLYLDANSDGIQDTGATLGAKGRQPGLFPDGSGNYRDAFYQDVPVGSMQWPDFASFYDEFKEFAIDHGRYYTTNSSGQILKDGVPVTGFKEEFTKWADANADGSVTSTERHDAPYDIVFIDTTDGLPPAANGSNLATVQLAGNGAAFKGIYYICANFDGQGVGNPPDLIQVEKPTDDDNDGIAGEPEDSDGVISGGVPNGSDLSKIFLDGVIYSAGTMSLSGNAGIYGCAVAQKGFTGGGTPNIWYNWRLKNGLNLQNGNAGSRFRTVLRKTEALGESIAQTPPEEDDEVVVQ